MPTPVRSSSSKACKSPAASSTVASTECGQEEVPTTPQHNPVCDDDRLLSASSQFSVGTETQRSQASNPVQKLEPVGPEPVKASGGSTEQLEKQSLTPLTPLLKALAEDVAVSEQVQSSAAELALEQESSRGKFRLRSVVVSALQKDNTLGLLLHGTSIVGFRIAQAQNDGWCKGDQIVEVNEGKVKTYDEFLQRFRQVQCENGFPIVFGVLRREDPCEAQETAEDTLHSFFSNTDFANLTGQFLQRWGESPALLEPPGNDAADEANQSLASSADVRPKLESGSTCQNIISSASTVPKLNISAANGISTENPFVQALKNRRDALFRSNEGWAKWADDDFANASESVASRLAQRQDGVSTLQFSRGEEIYAAMPEQKPACSWPFCMPSSASLARRFQSVDEELAPTPRVHHYEQPDSRYDPSIEPPWLASVAASLAASRSTAADCTPPIAASASALACPPDGVDAQVPDMPPRKNSDSSILAQLLLASLVRDSDSEEEDVESGCRQQATSPLAAGAEVEETFSGSADVVDVATDAGNDVEIWLPRKQQTENASCAGITHARAEALLVGKALV